MDIYHGSPRALLYLDDPIESKFCFVFFSSRLGCSVISWHFEFKERDSVNLFSFSENPQLTIIIGCQLLFTVTTHRNMHKAMNFLQENVLYGLNDTIPGVDEQRSRLQGKCTLLPDVHVSLWQVE